MKHMKYVVLLLLCCQAVHAFSGRSFMTYRSTGFNLARNNSGWLDRCTKNNTSIAVEYMRSFDKKAINEYYFGCDQPIIFSGSRVANRGSNDILADYYGLPTDFKSSLCFSPRIQNVVTDFDFYWLLGCEEDSRLNLRVNIPVTHSRWALNPCERIIDKGSLDYPAGYMSNAVILNSGLRKGALEALTGEKTFGDLMLPLRYGRISRCTLSRTKFSDVLVALGYNILCEPDGRLGVDVHVVIPTGTRSRACYLFEPQIGNGHHWALGASISGQYNIVDSDYQLSVQCDAYVQHLFKTRQKRSYDFNGNGCGSRYMLIMDMIRSISQAQGFSITPGEDLLQRQYITRLSYGIDASTLDSTIKINVQADILAKLSLIYHNWNIEAGYNFWARSREKLICRESLRHQFYGVKGDAQLYGFLNVGFTFLSIPLNATQSKATLHAPQGDGNTTNNFINSNADNADLMFNVGAALLQTNPDSLVNTGVTGLAQVNGSNQAIVLSDRDINICSGLSPRAISHKIFGSVRYTFDKPSVQPYILIGGEGEFASNVNRVKTAISQWGIWFKAGLSY